MLLPVFRYLTGLVVLSASLSVFLYLTELVVLGISLTLCLPILHLVAFLGVLLVLQACMSDLCLSLLSTVEGTCDETTGNANELTRRLIK